LLTLSGKVVPLAIDSSRDVRYLHHVVRRLTNTQLAFNLVHEDRGCIFGNYQDYGSAAWWYSQKKKLCNLRIRNGCAIAILILPIDMDDDGKEIPCLLSDVSGDSDFESDTGF
jgi:hypothetical protein